MWRLLGSAQGSPAARKADWGDQKLGSLVSGYSLGLEPSRSYRAVADRGREPSKPLEHENPELLDRPRELD